MTRRRNTPPIRARAAHHTSEAMALGYVTDAITIARVTDRLVREGFPIKDAARAAQTAWDATTAYPPN